MSVLSNAEIKPVYYPIKKVNGKMQFRRAPFNVLIHNGVPYIQPYMGGMPDTALDNMGGTAEVRDMVRGDFAYESLDAIVVEEHQMGDGSDNWIGLNAVSNI